MLRILAIFVAVATIVIGLETSAQTGGSLPPMALPSGSVAVIVNEPCCALQRDFPLQKSADATVLETVRDRAYRNGPVLQLRLDGDRSLKIVDSTSVGERCDGFDGCRIHRLAAWWQEHRYYVVDIRLWEGVEGYLIAERDGRVIPIAAPPLLSPSGRYAIASDSSLLNGSRTELLDMSVDPPAVHPVSVTSICPAHSGLLTLGSQLQWVDNTRIVFSNAEVFFKGGAKKVSLTLRIIDGKPKWEC